jgi:hypothetical protein
LIKIADIKEPNYKLKEIRAFEDLNIIESSEGYKTIYRPPEKINEYGNY